MSVCCSEMKTSKWSNRRISKCPEPKQMTGCGADVGTKVMALAHETMLLNDNNEAIGHTLLIRVSGPFNDSSITVKIRDLPQKRELQKPGSEISYRKG
ncbi:hypothetical protein J6590_014096 [Homalodisca vitripennis]|nr:hypothetical protein J6590_014096 [Homalodisca vitripennis]